MPSTACRSGRKRDQQRAAHDAASARARRSRGQRAASVCASSRYASIRCVNCTVSTLSKKLRHQGCSKNSRAADGMNAPSMAGQVLKARPGPQTRRPAHRNRAGRTRQHDDRVHGPPQAARRRRALLRLAAQAHQRPDDQRVDRQRQHQMHGEAILRDFGAHRQAGRHHPPADRALQRAEREDQPQPALQPSGRAAAPEERTGTAAGTQRRSARPSKRWLHSHQKMVLNSSRLIPRLTC